MSTNQGQQPLELELPEKSTKKKKGYYLSQEIIDYIKDESDRLSIPGSPGTKKKIVSENDVLTAIIICYQKMTVIKGEGGPAYDAVSKNTD